MAAASLRGGVGFGLAASRWSMRLRARRNCVTVLTGCSDCMPPPSADEETTALGPQIARSSLPRPRFGFLSALVTLSNALGSFEAMPSNGRHPAAFPIPSWKRTVSSCVGGGVGRCSIARRTGARPGRARRP